MNYSLEDHLRAIGQSTISQLQSCDVALVDRVKGLLQKAGTDREPSGAKTLYAKIQEYKAKGSPLSKTGEFSELEARSAIRSGLDSATPFDPRVEDIERICHNRSCPDLLRFCLTSLIWLENFLDFTPSLRPGQRGRRKERPGWNRAKRTVKQFAEARNVRQEPAVAAIYYGRKIATFVEAYGDIGILVELTQTFTSWRRLTDAELRQCAEWCRVGRTFAEARSRTKFIAECEKEYGLLFRERRTENINWPLVPRRTLCADAFSIEKIAAGIQADMERLTLSSSSTEQETQEAPASSTAPRSRNSVFQPHNPISQHHISPNADMNLNTNFWPDFNTNLLPDFFFFPDETSTNSFQDFNTNFIGDLLPH